MKGLTVNIFTSTYERTPNFGGGGHALSGLTEATIVGVRLKGGEFLPVPERSQVFEATPERPAIVLKQHVGIVIAEPLEGKPEGAVGFMAAGAYVATSDSRFTDLVESLLNGRFHGAIPLHDRWERKETYAALCQ